MKWNCLGVHNYVIAVIIRRLYFFLYNKTGNCCIIILTITFCSKKFKWEFFAFFFFIFLGVRTGIIGCRISYWSQLRFHRGKWP